MREDQRTITAWADETFGPVTSIARSLSRANEEAAELIRELCDGDEAPGVSDEAADIAICLYRSASVIGFDLDAATVSVPGDLPFGKPSIALAGIIAARITTTIAVTADDTRSHVWTATANLAQALIFCRRIAEIAGEDLADAIDRKMKRNRARKWRPDGTGHGYHVKAGENIDKAAAGIAEAMGLDWSLLGEFEEVGDAWEMGSAKNVTRESIRDLARIAIEAAPVPPLLSFVYTNWRGETERRRVRLLGLRRGSTEWHPEPQLLLRAFCLDRQKEREFALSGIREMK